MNFRGKKFHTIFRKKKKKRQKITQKITLKWKYILIQLESNKTEEKSREENSLTSPSKASEASFFSRSLNKQTNKNEMLNKKKLWKIGTGKRRRKRWEIQTESSSGPDELENGVNQILKRRWWNRFQKEKGTRKKIEIEIDRECYGIEGVGFHGRRRRRTETIGNGGAVLRASVFVIWILPVSRPNLSCINTGFFALLSSLVPTQRAWFTNYEPIVTRIYCIFVPKFYCSW